MDPEGIFMILPWQLNYTKTSVHSNLNFTRRILLGGRQMATDHYETWNDL